MKVKLCPDCGRLILTDFLYCPYCGAAVSRGPELAEALEAPFARLEASETMGVDERLRDLEGRLSALESDMETFLSARSGL